MKKFLLVLVATMGVSLSAVAQDVIVLKNAEEVQAKVESVGVQEVIYRKWENVEGPTYTLPKSDILFVKYANGQKDVFSNQQTSSRRKANQSKSVANPQNTQESFDGKLEGYAYADLGLEKSNEHFSVGIPTFGVSLGSRISKYLYIGGGIGWRNSFSVDKRVNVSHYIDDAHTTETCDYARTYWGNQINITADLKAYIPTKCGLYPRFDFSFGPAVSGSYYDYRWSCGTPFEPASEYKCFVGLYTSLGVGFDYRRLSFGVGFQTAFGSGSVTESYGDMIITTSGPGVYSGYVRLGFRFGKKQ